MTQEKQVTTSSNSNSANHHKKRIERLFLKFAAFYGYIWRNQFKSDDFMAFSKKEWLEGLRPYSDEVLAKVILHCREYSEYPPTLPQMIGFCRKEIKRSNFFKAEEVELAQPEIRKKHMDCIKNKLGQKD